MVPPTPLSLGLPPLRPPIGCLEQLQVVTHAHVQGQVAVVGPHVALGYLRGEAAANLRLLADSTGLSLSPKLLGAVEEIEQVARHAEAR